MENTTLPEAEIAQTEKIGLGDFVIVCILGALTWFCSALWEFPGLHPSVWADAAVASGVRPAVHVVPGYWTLAASIVYGVVGQSAAPAAFRLLGHLCMAGIAVCVYVVLREWLAFAMRARPQLSRRRTFVMRIASMMGAIAFVAAEPVWTAGQCFSETTVHLVLTLAALEFFFVFLRKGTVKYAYLCVTALGLLAAETPMGLFLIAFLVLITCFVLKMMPAMESPFFDPTVMEVGKWLMTFLFIASVVLGVALNCWVYLSHDGAAAIGASAGDVPLRYLLDYWQRLTSATSLGGWILWMGVCFLPYLVTTMNFPQSADEEQFLPYSSGLIFLFCGVLALAQLSFLPALWFWTYFPVDSQFFLSVGLFCCAATLTLSVAILGVDTLCRDHKRLAEQAFGAIPMQGEEDDEDDEDEPRRRTRKAFGKGGERFAALKSTMVLRKIVMLCVPVVLVALIVPGRVKSTTCEMLSIVRDAVNEIVSEAKDAKFLFTDGNLDTAIELEAARRGLPLRCYSLTGGGGAMGVFLRLRGLKDSEDVFSFRCDTGMGLRSWIHDRPEKLNNAAALMGFDLWKRDGKPIPPMSGLVSRPTGWASAEEAERGIRTAHWLAQRVLAIYKERGGLKGCTDAQIRRVFQIVQWRLARMCLYRSEAYDSAANGDAAIAEVRLGSELNELNEIFQNLIETMERRNQMLLQKLTPREGLQLALVRANFTMGKAYAETILGSEPDNPDANFAMGMFYLEKRQLTRAERYLTRCLVRKPNEPAVYNNLAMIQIELKRFDAAQSNIEKALKLIPNAAAVLDTRKRLNEAKAAAGQE